MKNTTDTLAPCGTPHGANGKHQSLPQSKFPKKNADLDAIQHLTTLLQKGPMSTKELTLAFNMKRGVLRKMVLLPAEKRGLIEKVECKKSSPNQRYVLTTKLCQVPAFGVTGSAEPVTSELKKPEKQAELAENGISAMPNSARARESTPAISLARFHRWPEAEKALIYYGRVERKLRSAFLSSEWKQLGIIGKKDPKKFIPFGSVLIDPKHWGVNGGVTLTAVHSCYNGKVSSGMVGESNLLSYFSRLLQPDLNICSATERAEMMALSDFIPAQEIFLMNYYGQFFNVPRSLCTPYHGKSEAMQIVAIDPFVATPYPRIIFHGKDRAPQCQLAYVRVAGHTILLPITYYASAQDPLLSCMMPEVPKKPIVYNSDVIAANPAAMVILSDEIAIPHVNISNGVYVFSSWYGGMEVIDMLDFDLLRGHQVRWLCYDDGDNPADKYKKALKVAAVFRKHGISIDYQLFGRVSWIYNESGMDNGVFLTSRVLSLSELEAEASQYGVGSTREKEGTELRDLSMDDLLKLKPQEFVLYPLLKEGFYCLVYGGSGVAKTWFALHLAICLSQGQAPFNHWEYRATAPCNVLYVAGEMREYEYGDRLRKLLAEQESNPHFRFLREDLDLTLEKDQNWVMKHAEARKSHVVVFDNLSTLATNGHTEGRFEKVLCFIRKLQAAGIIVLLVHHENREGGFKGSGKIELVADQSLHLFSTGNGDKIELLVRAEKIRMTSKNEQAAFHATFDPKNPKATWETKPLTKKERLRLDIDDPFGEVERNVEKKRRNNQVAWDFLDDDERAQIIIEDMLLERQDDVIAANLAVREPVIAGFKQQYGISKESLIKYAPEAKTAAQKKHGKIAPDTLAPELWKFLKTNEKKEGQPRTEQI